MNVKKTRIFQQHFSVSKNDDDLDNYLVVVEIVNDEPRHSYVVPMHNFKYWSEHMPYYVVNNN